MSNQEKGQKTEGDDGEYDTRDGKVWVLPELRGNTLVDQHVDTHIDYYDTIGGNLSNGGWEVLNNHGNEVQAFPVDRSYMQWSTVWMTLLTIVAVSTLGLSLWNSIVMPKQGLHGDTGSPGAPGRPGEAGTPGDTGIPGTPGNSGNNANLTVVLSNGSSYNDTQFYYNITEYSLVVNITTNSTIITIPGPKGDPGTNSYLTLGSIITGEPGSNVTIYNAGNDSFAIWNISIPRGNTGEDGTDGEDGTSTSITIGNTTTTDPGTWANVTFTGNTTHMTLEFSIPRGDTGNVGPDGMAALIVVGSTTTGAPNTSASVINTGNLTNVMLNFTIPKGEDGECTDGRNGTNGSDGSNATLSISVFDYSNSTNITSFIYNVSDYILIINITENSTFISLPGPQGPDGNSTQVVVGITTTGAPGTLAIVTNGGNITHVILDFVIPQGATGNSTIVSVGTTTTGLPGTFASVTNSGNATHITLEFTIPQGLTGNSTNVTVGTTTTGLPGTSASVTNTGNTTNVILTFVIPQGSTGNSTSVTVGLTTTGLPGTSASVTNTGNSTNVVLTFVIPQGATGNSTAVTVGSTTTGLPGTPASVTNTGNSTNVVLTFVIPQGATGSTGTSTSVTVGTTTTGLPGTSASVTNGGTPTDVILNFIVPQGPAGVNFVTGRGLQAYDTSSRSITPANAWFPIPFTSNSVVPFSGWSHVAGSSNFTVTVAGNYTIIFNTQCSFAGLAVATRTVVVVGMVSSGGTGAFTQIVGSASHWVLGVFTLTLGLLGLDLQASQITSAFVLSAQVGDVLSMRIATTDNNLLLAPRNVAGLLTNPASSSIAIFPF